MAKLVLRMRIVKWVPKREYWKIFGRVVRVSADVAVFNGNGRVLLAKRDIPPHKGSWHLPGGMVRRGERVSAAAIRKIKEETGLKIKLEKFVGFWDNPKRVPGTHDVTLVFRGKIVGGKLHGSAQGRDVKFFKIKNLPKMFFEHKKEIEIARKGKVYWWNK